jgi:Sec-independent protein translocase protein TatA
MNLENRLGLHNVFNAEERNFEAMAEEQKGKEAAGSFTDNLRDIQGEYIMLTELYEKEKDYGQKLSDMMKTLQSEVDSTIPIRPEAIGEGCKEAYLVSEAVVVLVDKGGNRISKPLYKLSAATIMSVIEECTPELRRLLFEKRKLEGNRVRSLERVLKELKKAQATFKQSRRDDVEEQEEQEEPKDEMRERAEEVPLQKEQTEVAPQSRPSREGFAFKGSFGEKREVPGISP